MATVKVVVDRSAMTKQLAVDPTAQAFLGQVAESYKGVVEQAAPVGRSLGRRGQPIKHGAYKRSIKVRKFRNGYRVYSTDAFSHIVEYGSVKNPAYAPMRRALRAFIGGGVKVKFLPKAAKEADDG